MAIENTTTSSSPEGESNQSFPEFEACLENKCELDKEIENQQEILKEFARENKEKFSW